MALTEAFSTGEVTILPDGQVWVQRVRIISDNEEEIARTYHRYVIYPGAALVNEPSDIQNLCEFIHTPAVISAYNLAKPAKQNGSFETITPLDRG